MNLQSYVNKFLAKKFNGINEKEVVKKFFFGNDKITLYEFHYISLKLLYLSSLHDKIENFFSKVEFIFTPFFNYHLYNKEFNETCKNIKSFSKDLKKYYRILPSDSILKKIQSRFTSFFNLNKFCLDTMTLKELEELEKKILKSQKNSNRLANAIVDVKDLNSNILELCKENQLFQNSVSGKLLMQGKSYLKNIDKVTKFIKENLECKENKLSSIIKNSNIFFKVFRNFDKF